MPVERTKSWKQSEAACNQLVWTMPVAPTDVYESAYITEVNAIDFADGPPPLVDAPLPPPGEFILFPPPTEDKPVARRAPHSKKKPENHIPRPPNAFILFRSSFIKSQHVSTEVETNHSTLSKIIGMTWKNMSESERQVWHAKAKVEQEEHRRKFPKYAFRPQQTKGKGGTGEKRKVREVEPKDLKRCEKIAQLLVQGKKGQELDAEIQEFDKHHVPQIIARFETPITARAFRRSSSAPIPDTENSRAGQTFLPSDMSAILSRKLRASSSRPTRCPTPEPTGLEQSDTASHDVQPLPLKQESSFDFGSFSFEGVSSPASSFECDPLLDPITDSFDHAQYGSDLSIDTSFMNDWSQCSSPLSPGASSYMTSPSPSPSFEVAAYDMFSQTLDKTFGDYVPTISMYQQQPIGGLCDESFLSAGDPYASFIQQPCTFNQMDLDFSSFMAPVPQYAL